MRIFSAHRAAHALVSKLGIDSAPVDVVRIANTLGLPIVYDDLGDDVSGLLITAGDTACICVHERHAIVRQRFTIAHEIAHHHLRHQFEPGAYVHVDDVARVSARGGKSATNVDPQEVEANQFAAAL